MRACHPALRFPVAVLAVAATLALAACQPEPPSSNAAPTPADDATALRDAIDTPLDKARAVESTLKQAEAAQRAAIEAAEASGDQKIDAPRP